MTPVLTLGPLTVTPFGLLVFAGAVCGVLLSLLRKKDIGPALPFVVLGALLFGHMWWAFFCPPGYSAEIGTLQLALRIWEGGYTLYGALFGGLLGAVIGTKLSGLHLTDTLDAMAPGACILLILCRLILAIWCPSISSLPFIYTLFLVCIHLYVMNQPLYEEVSG